MAATESNVSLYINSAISTSAELVNKDGGADGVLQTSLVGFTGGYLEFFISEPARYTLEIDSVEQKGCIAHYLGSSINSPTTNGIIILDTYGNPKDSGVVVSTDGTHADDSDIKVPTQKAVKTYSDTKVPKTTTVNANALNGNIVLDQDDIGDGATYVRLTAAMKAKLDFITVTGAVDLDITIATDEGIVNLLAVGGTNATKVIRAIAALISDDTAVGRMLAANKQDYVSGAGTPSATNTVPEYTGQLYLDVTNDIWYKATDVTAKTDFKALNS